MAGSGSSWPVEVAGRQIGAALAGPLAGRMPEANRQAWPAWPLRRARSMPIEASTEQQSHSGGWTLDGEYVPAGKKRGDAQEEAVLEQLRKIGAPDDVLREFKRSSAKSNTTGDGATAADTMME